MSAERRSGRVPAWSLARNGRTSHGAVAPKRARVFGIVKQNAGLISVYSEPGQGTTFKLYLPRADAPPSGRTRPPESVSLRGFETELMVEDEGQVLNLGQRILEQHGYTVLTARTPEDALAKVEAHQGPLHLLITDVVMPRMNGKELRDRLQGRHPALRCLFMSGYTANVIAHHGVLDDNVDLLQKPFTIETLTRKIREVLTRGA